MLKILLNKKIKYENIFHVFNYRDHTTVVIKTYILKFFGFKFFFLNPNM